MPKKYLEIIHRIRRLVEHEDRLRISYSALVTIKSERDRAIVDAIGKIDGEIIDESNIPNNCAFTEFIAELVLNPPADDDDDGYSDLRKRISDNDPESLSFFTREEFDSFFTESGLEKLSLNDERVNVEMSVDNFCEIIL